MRCVIHSIREYKSVGDTYEQMIDKQRGYAVLDLAPPCDGLPRYSHGGMYDGVDKTSLRGAFLQECVGRIDVATLNQAWTRVMRPQAAVAYGERLLAAASAAPPSPAVLEAIRASGDILHNDLSDDEIRDILMVAGKWYVYWGSRGHPIWAYS